MTTTGRMLWLVLDAHASVAADGRRMVDRGTSSWGATMPTAETEKYRSGLTVIRGGRSQVVRGRRRGGRRLRTAAELVLDRDMHTAFVQVQDGSGNTPSQGFEDIRRHRQFPWRVLARRIVEAHAVGASHGDVRRIGLTLLAWVDRLYERNVETVTERVTFYQSAMPRDRRSA